jgi:hypothetical protein
VTPGLVEHARELFARRDALARELARIDAAINVDRVAWSDAKGYRVAVRPEAFRREVVQ